MFLTAPFISDFCHRIPSCCYSTKFKKDCCVIRKRRFSGFSVFVPSVLERSHHRTSSSRDDLFCYRPKCCFPVMSTSESASDTKFGFIALLGKTNSGKSTLLNALVETKVAIVTPRVQTTRSKIVGVFTQGNSQLAFMDTPGIFTPKRRLERAMIDVAKKARQEADLIVLVVDVSKVPCFGAEVFDETTMEIAKLCSQRKAGSELFLCLNKIDLVSDSQLKQVEAAVIAGLRLSFGEIFRVSALTGQGVREMRDGLIPFLPKGPWLFESDDMTSMPMRSYAAEITREKLMLKLREELPYAIAVETVDWKDKEDGSIRMLQHIFVERESQKAIILGRGGQNLKQFGMEARQELAQVFGKPVHLFLQVKVRKDWSEDVDYYKSWGLKYRV